MKHLNHLIIILMPVLILTACNSVKTQDMTTSVPTDELCTQVKKLIVQHGDGFQEIKGKVHIARYVDVWDAKYHLVGKGCQIWRWSDGKQAYMCSVTVPNKQVAIEKHIKAIKFSKQCLGSEWIVENIENQKTGAYRSIFSRKEQNTVASVHRVNTEGLFKSEWTVYYFIGDRDKSL